MTTSEHPAAHPSAARAATARTRKPARTDVTSWHGQLEGMSGGLLYGWAFNPLTPDQRAIVEICLDGATVGCVIADMARADLTSTFAALGGPAVADPCHGFVADLGADADQRSGALTARIANQPTVLAGVVHSGAAAPAPAGATSMVYSDGALRLHGWAADPAEPSHSVTVRAYLGAHLLAETVAQQFHPGRRGHAAELRGFELDLPLRLADGRLHSVRVVDDLGRDIHGSPLTVCCVASGLKTLVPGGASALLDQLIDVYERHVPRSVGLAQYPAWSALFETAALAPAVPASPPRVGLIVSGAADDEAYARSAASLALQQWPALRVFGADGPAPFAGLLAQARAAGCEVLGCVRAGDTLVPHALACAMDGLAQPGASVVYSDSQYQDRPWLKPAWNREYAYASDYPLELLLARADGDAGLSVAHSAAQFAWQALAGAEGASAIVHVPRVLYHHHSMPDGAEAAERLEAARAALHRAEPGSELAALARPAALHAQRRVSRPLDARARATTVSLIIPTRDHVDLLRRCMDTLQTHTDWAHLELIIVDNGSTQAATKTYLRTLARRGVTVLDRPGPFNFATLNNDAVAHARGEVIGLVNNDIEALHDGWLDELLAQLLRPGVGAVGAKLLWPNGMVQHGGVLLGVGNAAGHFGNRLAAADPGDHGRNLLAQEVSAVTAACLLLRKADYLAVGGMDEAAFPVAFNDVDLCIKLRRAGLRIVWTPHATLLHAESASRGHEDTPAKRARAQRELDQLRARWGEVLLRDPAYHPSLNLDPHSHAFGGLALPPRARDPRGAGLEGAIATPPL